ncbi:MAG: hypothetical protein ABS939_22330, partial [Psychrobacillus sp.]
MDEAKLADGKIANFVTTNGLVSGTTVDNKINAATGEISKKITTVENKIPTEIGGRNYIINSNFARQLNNWVASNSNYISANNGVVKISNLGNVGIYQLVEEATEDETYTVSAYIKGTGSIRIGFENSVQFMTIPSAEQFTRVHFTARKGGSRVFVVYINDANTTLEIRNIQAEKGSVLTDWKLAQEDNYTQSEFAIFERTYSESVKGINSTLTDLSTKKLDGTTYTDFYKNEYTQTAQGVTDVWTAVNKIVDKDGNTTDTFAKAVYDQNATRRTASFNEVTKDLVTTTTYSEGIKGIDQSISSIRGNISDLSKARNLLKNSWHSSEENPVVRNANYILKKYDLIEPLVSGEQYTYRMFGSTDREEIRIQAVFEDGLDNVLAGLAINTNYMYKEIGYDGYGGYVSEVTFTVPSNYKKVVAILLKNFPMEYTGSGQADIYWATLTKGSVGIDWSPSVVDRLGRSEFTIFKNDYAETAEGVERRLTAIDSGEEGSIAYRLNETESTASGNTTTISNIKTKPGEQITGYQTIKDRSDLYERVIGSVDEKSVKDSVARIVMTDSTFQTEVVNRQALLAGMASGTSMTKDPYFNTGTNGIVAYDSSNSNLVSTSRVYITETASPMPKGNGYRLAILHKSSGSGVQVGVSRPTKSWANGTVVIKFSATLPVGKKFSYQTDSFGSGNSSGWLTDNKGTGKWQTYMYYYTFGNSGTFNDFGKLCVDGEHSAFNWFLSEYDIINVNETSASKLTQLADNINLKVTKGQLLSQINVEAGNVLIQSGTNKLNVTPETTYIEDATIKSAMIDTVDVKKITGIAADFTTMVTKGLTANVISSTMINANDALFDKLFSNTMATTKLVAQGAWIEDANIKAIDAGTITSGEIEAARIKSKDVVSQGLTADVVKATHIKAEVGLVDKIFSTTAYIEELTNKTIFTEKIQAIN